MSYDPLLVIVFVLVIGATVTLTILFRANERGLFDNLRAGAYVIFDDDEPVGKPQDMVFHTDKRDDASSLEQRAQDDSSSPEPSPDRSS